MIADLYIRVSTDDQAERGYSQRDQEERLRKYCELNSIKIGEVITEDHSAKNFDRPEWKKYITYVKKKSTKTNIVLFTKWDRFSRNAGDAYQMINILKKCGVVPQSIEQPLNMDIPESKVMLAIYLATPEVENDRRALNTFYGMRRAKKEGRMMGTAPFGYLNRCTKDGKKYVALNEHQAKHWKWAFEEIAKNQLAPEQIRREMNKRGGFMMSTSAFHAGIRNPIYCGKIFIEQYKDEDSMFVQAQHEPIVNEILFNKVQSILDGNKRNERPKGKILSHDNLPLRGFLVCPKCQKTLTGSGSKGSHSIFYYYHCNSKCGVRFRASEANSLFFNVLEKFSFNEPLKSLLRKHLLDSYKNFYSESEVKKKEIMKEIEHCNNKIVIAREKFLENQLDQEDYSAVKKLYSKKIGELENELNVFVADSRNSKISAKIDDALKAVTHLPLLYENGCIETKREIIRSTFPEKLEFNGKTYRTIRNSVVLDSIVLLNSILGSSEKSKIIKKTGDSCLVNMTGLSSNTFIRDLLKLEYIIC